MEGCNAGGDDVCVDGRDAAAAAGVSVYVWPPEVLVDAALVDVLHHHHHHHQRKYPPQRCDDDDGNGECKRQAPAAQKAWRTQAGKNEGKKEEEGLEEH